MSISDVPVAGNACCANVRPDHERYVVCQKLVPDDLAHALQQRNRFTRRDRGWDGRHVGRHAYKAGFGKGCCRPRLVAATAEPRQRGPVVDVVGPGQTYEEVDVKQVRQVLIHLQRRSHHLVSDWLGRLAHTEDRESILVVDARLGWDKSAADQV